jgi:hypothetical protein
MQTIYSFQVPPGAAYPLAGPVVSPSGVVYGTTYLGGSATACGSSGCGTVFELTPPSSAGGAWIESLIYGFSGYPNGKQPQTGLVLGAGGALYGSADGAVFELTPPVSPDGAWTETTVYNFSGALDSGGPPTGNLAVGPSGSILGTTAFGGAYGKGKVFELTPPASPGGAWTLALLYSFSGFGDGSQPDTGVVFGGGGAIYGTTYKGGAGYGAVFGLGLVGEVWQLKMRADLDGGTLNHPSGLALGHDGAIYGQTGSVIFRAMPPATEGAAWPVKSIYTGGYINGLSVTVGSTGAIYFTTPTGGTSTACGNLSGCGTLNALMPPTSPGGAWTPVVLHNFTGQQGEGYWRSGRHYRRRRVRHYSTRGRKPLRNGLQIRTLTLLPNCDFPSR